jgi:hypothetical protein
MTAHTLPVGRDRSDFVIEPLGDETLVYDTANARAHCLNKVASTVWMGCDGKTTEGEMLKRLDKLGYPSEPAVIQLALEELQKAELLPKRKSARAQLAQADRRRVLKQIGVGLSVPVVLSILAPSAADAAPLLPPGSPCTQPKQCQSHFCHGKPPHC